MVSAQIELAIALPGKRIGAIVRSGEPPGDGWQVSAPCRLLGLQRTFDGERLGNVAMVSDGMAQRPQGAGKIGRPQGSRAHHRPCRSGAKLQRDAKDGNAARIAGGERIHASFSCHAQRHGDHAVRACQQKHGNVLLSVIGMTEAQADLPK
jgi:hypothetical protein